MLPTFGVERELSFANFSVLEEVTVFDGVQLSSSAFENCVKLTKINGAVNITGAVNAFSMSSTNATLGTVKITGTEIPNSAFKNCVALYYVLKDNVQVAPTVVGNSAFEGCSSLNYMNLSNLTTLGSAAFKNAVAFKGDTYGSKILTVGAAKIEANAFEKTAVEMVDFTNATTIDKAVFYNCSALKQVRFNKVFEGVTQDAATNWNGTFGGITATTNIVLFVATGQAHVKSNVLELPYTNAADETVYTDYTFKGIYKN